MGSENSLFTSHFYPVLVNCNDNIILCKQIFSRITMKEPIDTRQKTIMDINWNYIHRAERDLDGVILGWIFIFIAVWW